MNYPQNLLGEGEEVQFMLRPHFRALLAPAIWLIGIAIIGGWLFAISPWSWLRIAILVTGAILIVPFVIVKFLRWLTTQYVFTNRRIITRMGIITRSGRDIPLAKVNNVSFDVSFLGRILNYGRLKVDSANTEGDLIIDDVPNVEVIQRKIYDLYESDDSRRRAGGNGYLPSDV